MTPDAPCFADPPVSRDIRLRGHEKVLQQPARKAAPTREDGKAKYGWERRSASIYSLGSTASRSGGFADRARGVFGQQPVESCPSSRAFTSLIGNAPLILLLSFNMFSRLKIGAVGPCWNLCSTPPRALRYADHSLLHQTHFSEIVVLLYREDYKSD